MKHGMFQKKLRYRPSSLMPSSNSSLPETYSIQQSKHIFFAENVLRSVRGVIGRSSPDQLVDLRHEKQSPLNIGYTARKLREVSLFIMIRVQRIR